MGRMILINAIAGGIIGWQLNISGIHFANPTYWIIIGCFIACIINSMIPE
jgi:hypothetical protein